LLGKGHGVVGTKRGVTAEENVRDNGCTERESNEPAFRLCMRVEAIILVNQMSMGFPWPVREVKEDSCSSGEWRSFVM